MHIPSGNTAELNLVTFQEALAVANTPTDSYDTEKWLYAPIFTVTTVTYWEAGAKSPSFALASTPLPQSREIWITP